MTHGSTGSTGSTNDLGDGTLETDGDLDPDILRHALAAMPVGVVLYRANGSLVFANDRLARLLGLSREDLATGSDFISLLQPRLSVMPSASSDDPLGDMTAPEPFEFSYTTAGGNACTGTHRPLNRGCFLRTFTIDNHLSTDDRSAGWAADHIPGLRTGSMEGVLVAVGRRIVYANERISELLAVNLADLQSSTIDRFIHPEDRTRLLEFPCQPGGSGHEFRALTATGSTIWLEAKAHAMDWKGELARRISVVDIEQRKRAEETLRENERRLRDFAQAGSDWFWETDADHRFTDFSENVLAATGNARESMLGLKRTDVIKGGMRPEQLREHLRILDARQPFKDLTYRTSSANGQDIWLRVSGLPVYDKLGQFCGFRGVGSNVTEEIEYRTRVEMEYERLLSALDNAPSGLALYDTEDRLIFASEAYRQLAPQFREKIVPGVTYEELLRLRLETGDIVDARGCEDAWIAKRMEQHRKPGIPITLRKGAGKWSLIAETRLADGSTVVSVTDISAQKQAELAHIASEHRFRELIDGSVQGIVIHRNDRVVYANASARRIRGYADGELIGRSVDDLIAPEERPRLDKIRKRRMAGLSVPDLLEYKGLCKDGSELWLEMVGRLVDWEGQPAIQVTETDITERYLAQQNMRQAMEEAEQANRVKSQFLANMSHELRTPLNAIVGFSEMIEQELLGPVSEPRYVGYAHDINASGQHLLAIINDILDLSRIEAGQSALEESAFALTDAIADCLRLIGPRAEESRVELRTEIPDTLPLLFADFRRLKQILINLLSNAVKFTGAGGCITISAHLHDDGSVCLSVADTGIGMAPQDIERALQPFVQLDTSLSRKFEGTGLGLALCSMLADMHQGQLEIASTPQHGTTVTLILPASRVLH